MFNLGPWEVGIILLVALIVVGPGKLPEVAKAIGKGMNEFKKAANGYKKEFQDAMNSVEEPVKEAIDDTKAAVQGKSVNDLAENFDATVKEKSETSSPAPEQPSSSQDK